MSKMNQQIDEYRMKQKEKQRLQRQGSSFSSGRATNSGSDEKHGWDAHRASSASTTPQRRMRGSSTSMKQSPSDNDVIFVRESPVQDHFRSDDHSALTQEELDAMLALELSKEDTEMVSVDDHDFHRLHQHEVGPAVYGGVSTSFSSRNGRRPQLRPQRFPDGLGSSRSLRGNRGNRVTSYRSRNVQFDEDELSSQGILNMNGAGMNFRGDDLSRVIEMMSRRPFVGLRTGMMPFGDDDFFDMVGRIHHGNLHGEIDLDNMSYEDIIALQERIGEVRPKGADIADVTRLPTEKFDQPSASSGGNEEAKCCICLEQFQSGNELRRLPCLHSFHAECVDKWLVINNACPVCRIPINSPGTDS